MKIKYKFTSIILFLSVSVAKAETYMTLTEVEAKAKAYFEAITQIVNNPHSDASGRSESILYEVVGVDRNGHESYQEFRIPNDMQRIDGTAGTTIPITTYVTRIQDLSSKRNIRMETRMLSSSYLRNVELQKGEDVPKYAQVVFKKRYYVGGKLATTLTDTIIVNTLTRSLAKVSNEVCPTIAQTSTTETVADLTLQALQFYNRKRYDEAFATYLRIMKADPKNEEASYALGVMLYKGQGCKQYSRAERDKLAIKYWEMSHKGERALNYVRDGRID